MVAYGKNTNYWGFKMKIRFILLLLLPLLLVAFFVWFLSYLYTVFVNPNRTWRLAVSADQLANAAFNGHEDETISSRAGRHSKDDDNKECWAVWLCWLLNKVDQNHCEKSIGV